MKSNDKEKFAKEQIDILDSFCILMDKYDTSKIILEKINKLPDSYIINNGFSVEECNYLMENINYDEDVIYQNTNNEVYRKNLRTTVNHPKVCDKIFNRIKNFLPQKYVIEKYEEEFGAFSEGDWVPSELNSNLRICKYLNEGFFKCHYDGCRVINKDERSFFTLMFYLNGNYEGGETVFVEKNTMNVIVSIKPTQGMMIFFPQNIYHEGKAVIGEKYIFRTDIMFKRIGGYEYSKEELEKKQLALKYFEMAGELERSKQGMEAVEYYKKAFKLDPDLEKVIK